jgi:hypothetical protein
LFENFWMIKMKSATYLLAVGFTCAINSPCTLYVASSDNKGTQSDDNTGTSKAAALATVHEAAARVALYDTAGGNDVAVCLGPGTHLLHEKPLTLTEAHSPDGIKVQWRSEDFENPAVISGGVALTKWVRCNDGVHCPWENWNDVWVSFVSDAKAGVALPKQALPVRQLWVNGDRATRIYTDTSMMGLKATPTGNRILGLLQITNRCDKYGLVS